MGIGMATATASDGSTWSPGTELLEIIDRSVPQTLAGQRADGRFGTEPWICGDQNVILGLAAVWSTEGSRYYRDARVLDAIARGGDALDAARDADGRWLFLKKDGSTWGWTYMPWTYSRWIRTYAVVGSALPRHSRERWVASLERGYRAICDTELGSVHNIPTHHAMGLYCAGAALGRSEWCDRAARFMSRVVREQSPDGWWAEHGGPVVNYNSVYVDALGTYYALSKDSTVLPALERAARYHALFTYPDGSAVETIDGRNPYRAAVGPGNVGLTYSPEGRGLLRAQHERIRARGGTLDPDLAANLLLYGGSGRTEAPLSLAARGSRVRHSGALLLREGPWFACLSGIVTEIPRTRWGEDRQNFFSVFNDHTGLIMGGGNTKLQPLWSTFTSGDTGLLRPPEPPPRGGPVPPEPDFIPPAGLEHVPRSASVTEVANGAQIELSYGPEDSRRRGVVRVEPRSERVLLVTFSSLDAGQSPFEAHATLIPHLDKPLRLGTDRELALTDEPREWTGHELGGWIEHAGWRLTVPSAARLIWPVLPFNPYRQHGEATTEEARIVVAFAFSGSGQEKCELEIRILDAATPRTASTP